MPNLFPFAAAILIAASPTPQAPALYTPERVEAELAALARRYPAAMRVERYGTSALGRPLLVARFGVAGPRRPVVFALFGQHPDEHDMNTLGMAFVHRLAERPGRSLAVSALLARAEVAVVPMANPDGTHYDLAEAPQPFEWRRNRRPRGKDTGTNLNANWGGAWKPAEPAGEAPFSEPETRALRDWTTARGRVAGFFDFHSGASGFSQGMVLLPEASDLPPAAVARHRAVGEAYAAAMTLAGDPREGYWTLPTSEVRARLAAAMAKHVPEPHRAMAIASLPTDTRAFGSTVAWAPGALGATAFGVEISRGFSTPDPAGYAQALATDYAARLPRLFDAFVAAATATAVAADDGHGD